MRTVWRGTGATSPDGPEHRPSRTTSDVHCVTARAYADIAPTASRLAAVVAGNYNARIVTELKEVLLEPGVRAKVVKDAETLVDSEVKSKSGFSGLAIKAGYKAVRAIKPELIPEAIDHMLDRFVEQLEPFYADWVANGKDGGFDQFLIGKKAQVANALLAVTDERARNASGTVRKTYDSLRPKGLQNVEAAVPGLGRVIQRYV